MGNFGSLESSSSDSCETVIIAPPNKSQNTSRSGEPQTAFVLKNLPYGKVVVLTQYLRQQGVKPTHIHGGKQIDTRVRIPTRLVPAFLGFLANILCPQSSPDPVNLSHSTTPNGILSPYTVSYANTMPVYYTTYPDPSHYITNSSLPTQTPQFQSIDLQPLYKSRS